MPETGLMVVKMKHARITHTLTHKHTQHDGLGASVQERLTWLVDSAEGMPGVVFPGLKAVFTEVKVVAVPAFEPGAVYRKHLAAITPADDTRSHLNEPSRV